MFAKRFKLFRLLGFEVKIDISWFFLAVLITWSLAQGFFPYYYKGLTPYAYWNMGVLGAVGLFFSIVFHEFSHSLVGRAYGVPIKGITLFIFGGVAEMDEEPPSARTEFLMAIAGPLSSYALAVACYALYLLGDATGWAVPLTGVLFYLALINFLLASFNLIPAFPLDGGRVLRSMLWKAKGDLRWATRVAARTGTGFAYGLIALGLFSVIEGNFIGGLWWFLIGMFLHGSARSAYQQLLLRQVLAGEPVRRFMNPNPVTVPSSITLQAFVTDYLYRYYFKMYPVVDDGVLRGCIHARQVKEVPQESWDFQTVAQVAQRCTAENSVAPDIDAITALSIMNRTGISRLMVVENAQLVGVIALKDLLKFFELKLDLEA